MMSVQLIRNNTTPIDNSEWSSNNESKKIISSSTSNKSSTLSFAQHQPERKEEEDGETTDHNTTSLESSQLHNTTILTDDLISKGEDFPADEVLSKSASTNGNNENLLEEEQQLVKEDRDEKTSQVSSRNNKLQLTVAAPSADELSNEGVCTAQSDDRYHPEISPTKILSSFSLASGYEASYDDEEDEERSDRLSFIGHMDSTDYESWEHSNQQLLRLEYDDIYNNIYTATANNNNTFSSVDDCDDDRTEFADDYNSDSIDVRRRPKKNINAERLAGDSHKTSLKETSFTTSNAVVLNTGVIENIYSHVVNDDMRSNARTNGVVTNNNLNQQQQKSPPSPLPPVPVHIDTPRPNNNNGLKKSSPRIFFSTKALSRKLFRRSGSSFSRLGATPEEEEGNEIADDGEPKANDDLNLAYDSNPNFNYVSDDTSSNNNRPVRFVTLQQHLSGDDDADESTVSQITYATEDFMSTSERGHQKRGSGDWWWGVTSEGFEGWFPAGYVTKAVQAAENFLSANTIHEQAQMTTKVTTTDKDVENSKKSEQKLLRPQRKRSSTTSDDDSDPFAELDEEENSGGVQKSKSSSNKESANISDEGVSSMCRQELTYHDITDFTDGEQLEEIDIDKYPDPPLGLDFAYSDDRISSCGSSGGDNNSVIEEGRAETKDVALPSDLNGKPFDETVTQHNDKDQIPELSKQVDVVQTNLDEVSTSKQFVEVVAKDSVTRDVCSPKFDSVDKVERIGKLPSYGVSKLDVSKIYENLEADISEKNAVGTNSNEEHHEHGNIALVEVAKLHSTTLLEALSIQEAELGEHEAVARSYHTIGEIYSRKEQYDPALRCFHEAHRIQQIVLEDGHPDHARILNSIGKVHAKNGSFDRAMMYHQSALRILKERYGEDLSHPLISQTLICIGAVYYKERNSLSAIESKFDGYNGFVQSGMLDIIARAHYACGSYRMAIAFFEEKLQLLKNSGGLEQKEVAATLKTIGTLCCRTGAYHEALDYHNEALQIEKKLGCDQLQLAESRVLEGLANYHLGQYWKAKDLFQEALKMQQETGEGNQEGASISYRYIGLVQTKLIQYDEAMKSYKKALDIQRNVLKPDHPSIIKTQLEIAILLSEQYKLDIALEQMNDVLTTQKRIHGHQHPNIADTLHALGTLLKRKGDYNLALQKYEECFHMRKRFLGMDHPSSASTLFSIASLHAFNGRPDKALRIVNNVLMIRKEALGGNHIDVANTLNLKGNALLEVGKATQALDCWNEALKIANESNNNSVARNNSLQSSSPSSNAVTIADIYVNIGMLHLRKCHFDEAKECLLNALSIYRSLQINDSHPRIVRAIKAMARVDREELLCV